MAVDAGASTPEKKYTLAKKIDDTPEVLVARFDPADGKPMDFDPGMFAMLFGIDSTGKKYIGRAFSISSDPSTPELEFFIVKEHMVGNIMHTSHFVDAKIGDVFMVRGPHGQFKFDPAKDPKVLFIAGGTGLAPFMSMLRHIEMTGAKTNVKLIYSIKYPTEIIRKDELMQVIRDIGAEIHITVTRPQPADNWTSLTGHVNADMIRNCSADCNERMCYICGPLPFVKAVKDALAALGIPPQRISADVWG